MGKMSENSEWIYTKDENSKAEWHLGIVARMERDFFESNRYLVQDYYNKLKKLHMEDWTTIYGSFTIPSKGRSGWFRLKL